MKKPIVYVIVLVLIFLSGFAPAYGYQGKKVTVQDKPFPIPEGSFNIGTQDFYWIDDKRVETFTKDPSDKRRLMVQVWYPTDHDIKGKGYPYIANPAEFGDNKRIKKFLNIRTNSIHDAFISKKLEKFPVIVFSHGMGNSRLANTSQVEHLVSHGYIVFGIEHTFFYRSQIYPDGYKIVGNGYPKYKKIKDDPKQTAKSDFEAYDNLERDIWLKDAEYVIKKIKGLNKSSKFKFYNRLDLSNMGMFGYSFGGTTTIEICSKYPGVKAGVCYDGPKIGDSWKKGLTQPFLFVERKNVLKTRKEVEHAGRDYGLYLEKQKVLKFRDKTFFDITKNTNYILTLSGTSHAHLMDHGLLEPQDEKLMDVRLCHKILNEYILAFFDKYLKNKKSDLLGIFPGKYKEAILLKK